MPTPLAHALLAPDDPATDRILRGFYETSPRAPRADNVVVLSEARSLRTKTTAR